MQLRSTLVTAAVSAAAALTATGITYASAASAPAPEQAPVTAAPHGGSSGQNNNSKGNEGNEDNDNNGHRGEDEGRIQINERSYSTRPGDCITVVSGLGAKSLNIRNESRKAVEVFRGAVCD
ncbi:hypothetical protein ACN6LA_007954, partial [Streptomyces sp. SAS_269]|uniref:hypothetical protein n=1 Tax=Streptomyces sp. SAS_269 TaxID=3412749 RepID=UPI00403D4093